MQNIKKARIWAILNLIGAALMLTANSLANALPINNYNTGQVSDFYPNLFAPAGITFSIWGLIYLLVIGFVIHGLVAAFKSNEQTHSKIAAIGPWFFISCMANAGWIFAWHYLYISLSVVIMLLILGSLIVIYLRIHADPFPRSFPEKLSLRWPFSIYLAWITIATVANITAFLVDLGWTRLGLSEDFWMSTMIGIAVLISALFVLRMRDSAYAWVIVWALTGIVIKQNSLGNNHLTGYYMAIAGIVIVAVLGGMMAFKKTKPHQL